MILTTLGDLPWDAMEQIIKYLGSEDVRSLKLTNKAIRNTIHGNKLTLAKWTINHKEATIPRVMEKLSNAGTTTTEIEIDFGKLPNYNGNRNENENKYLEVILKNVTKIKILKLREYGFTPHAIEKTLPLWEKLAEVCFINQENKYINITQGRLIFNKLTNLERIHVKKLYPYNQIPHSWIQSKKLQELIDESKYSRTLEHVLTKFPNLRRFSIKLHNGRFTNSFRWIDQPQNLIQVKIELGKNFDDNCIYALLVNFELELLTVFTREATHMALLSAILKKAKTKQINIEINKENEQIEPFAKALKNVSQLRKDKIIVKIVGHE